MSVKLSILTPSIPSRTERLQVLTSKLADQIRDLPIEHLVLIDNKRRTIGEKRDALLRASIGEYIAFVDDDDDITDHYALKLIEAIDQRPDVVTFEQLAYFNRVPGGVTFRHGAANEEWKPEGMCLRAAWHVCAWRRDIAITSHFPAINYGEDWAFCEPLNKLSLKEVHIPEVLHIYQWDHKISEANP